MRISIATMLGLKNWKIILKIYKKGINPSCSQEEMG